MPSTITAESRVGEIVAEFPATSRTFHKLGIDFCCGGGQSLEKVCDKKGIDVSAVVTMLESSPVIEGSDKRWTESSTPGLIGHILSTFHEPLRTELPRLQEMLEKVHRVHGHVDPERLGRLLQVFSELKVELEEHMEKEEKELFPVLMRADVTARPTNLAELEDDHEHAGKALRIIRELTDNFTPPDYACNTWRALWDGLRELEASMHEHVHLENNVLFPRFAVETA